MSHSTRVTNTDEMRRERWHASSRARRPQLHFVLAAQAVKVSLGGRRRKMPSAEQGRRCNNRGLERVHLGLSLGSNSFCDIRSGCRHSYYIVCHAIRISTSTCHQRGGTLRLMFVMGKAGHHPLQGRAIVLNRNTTCI